MIFFDSIYLCLVEPSSVNSWVELSHSSEEFETVNVVVKKKGRYSFTLYQEHPRKYNKKSNEASVSWIYLVQSKGGKKIATQSALGNNYNLNISSDLSPGPYIIFTKVQWQPGQKHTSTLTSYGPDRLTMKRLEKWNPNRLS